MDALHRLMLERERLVVLPDLPDEPGTAPDAVAEFETDLLDLGFVLAADLRAALAALPLARLEAIADDVVGALAAQRGADRPHVPLFRRFPRSTPRDTEELFAARIVTFLFQSPTQPCLLCGTAGTVHAVSPCGHLVCSRCWDGAEYGGCPICHRRLDVHEPFLQLDAVAEGRSRVRGRRRGSAGPPTAVLEATGGRLTRLRRAAGIEDACAALLTRLLARSTPLSPDDRDALKLLLTARPEQVSAALPEHVPVRETLALVLGHLLRERPPDPALVAAHLRTATDVLRVLSVVAGGEPDLLGVPRPRRPIPRPVRRTLLDRLEALPAEPLVEDVLRHRELWKRLGHDLHPFVEHAQRPKVALAFAVLRGTRVDETTPLGRTLATTAARTERVTLTDGRLRFTSWRGEVEAALAANDAGAIIALLRARPGELARRLDHTLRRIDPRRAGDVAAALEPDRVAAPLLLTLASHLRHRHTAWARRVFFPKGDLSLFFSAPDDRPPLPADVVLPVVDRLEAELLGRAGRAEAVGGAMIDHALADVPMPVAERSAARALHAVPRGTVLPLPDVAPLRLFLHWMQDRERVDLDLSVALFDDEWNFAGLCDYTHLRFQDGAAVHSGDLTSAPPPLGASEFLDLAPDELRLHGIRHVVAVVFSYNSVPFEHMREAFAGFMARPRRRDSPFDPAAVLQRFDLEGRALIAIPLVADLVEETLRWVDVRFTAHGRFHRVGGYRWGLSRLGRDMGEAFAHRPTLWELTCLHAAARARTVEVRRADGAVERWARRPDESPAAFLAAFRDGRRPPDDAPAAGGPVLAALLRDDVDLPPGSAVYALERDRHDPAVEPLTAGDLLAALD